MASDARMDEASPPSLGVLILDPLSGRRWGFVSVLQEPLKLFFNEERTTIAHVELCAVVAAVMHMHTALTDRDCLWFIDNSVALACLCKGNSDSAALDAGTAAVHFALAFLRSRMWFEYIESHANWADSVSRLLHACPWTQSQGFELHDIDVPLWVWQTPIEDLFAAVCDKIQD